ncbi:MAG: hypothetical protein PHF44_03470 [Candidatus Pacebacteria bacterium]|nr:hypothetical protein [Candidatus Paceibacterota bacterium]
MVKVAERQGIFFQWLVFHFFDFPKELLRVWRNFLSFYLNYFSIPLLFRTLFAYWRRHQWAYPNSFDIGKYIEALASNLVSRILGAIMRIIFILVGVSVEIFIVFMGIIVILGWVFLPAILILGIYYGSRILF